MRCFSFALLVLVAVSIFGQRAQAQPFDVEAYRHFLEVNAEMDAAGLLQMHAAGSFANEAVASFDEALYADSVESHYHLTPYERSLLARHGFMVTERVRPESFGQAYTDVWHYDLPVFVSTDAILHALHMSYDLILQEVEAGLLAPRLETLLQTMHEGVNTLADDYAGVPGMEVPLRDLDVYLTVPRTLLSGAPVAPVFPQNDEPVGELLALVEAEQAASYPLFADNCRILDFSQFTPRGHYAHSETLTRYFQAMMWLGRTEIYLTAPQTGGSCAPSPEDVQRQVVMAVLVSELVEATGAGELLREVDEMIALFAGEPDNTTLGGLRAVLEAAGVTDAAELLAADRQAAFESALLSSPYAGQRILSQIIFSDDPFEPDRVQPASAFMLLGQRFVVDSYVTGSVVFDKVDHEGVPVRRMLPSTLDVLFALGNDAAGQLLEEELERFYYANELAALRYLVDAYGEDFWQSSLYNGWLAAIRTLAPPAGDRREALPPFMQTAAWWQEKMNTQLAAWAQLRHDNLLYAKQSYTGAISCSLPYSYVEPIPAFYEAVSRFAETAAGRFADIQVDWPERELVVGHFEFVRGVVDTLASVARKELAGTPVSEEERAFLRSMVREENTCGPQIDGWYPSLFFGGPDQSKVPDLVVADMHTAPTDAAGQPVGWVLHAGTGPLDMAVVVAEVPGVGPVAFTGPVMSYYEHLSTGFERLTDELWERAYAAEPSFRPDFVNLYLADENGAQRPPGRALVTAEKNTLEPLAPAAASTFLRPPYPNPFREATALVFTVAPDQAHQPVRLDVYDVQGRLVATLVDEPLPTGQYVVRWDGLRENGTSVAAGAYLATLRVGGRRASQVMTRLR